MGKKEEDWLGRGSKERESGGVGRVEGGRERRE